jgi:glycosyltransferase involved in cell wall biosynthesis
VHPELDRSSGDQREAVPTIGVISFTNLKSDPRVRRQLDALRSHYSILACGTADPELDGVRFIGCSRARRTLLQKAVEARDLLVRRYESHYWQLPHVRELRSKLAGQRFDTVIANDLESLPLALDVAGRASVVFDAHEYAPRELEDRFLWRVFRRDYNIYLCRKYLPRASAGITVTQGIADEFERNFGIRPAVIDNAAPYHDLAPRPTDGTAVRMIHHGIAMPSRKLENMIDLMAHLDDRFQLDLMLMPTDPGYLRRLEARARTQRRVRFLPPVPMQELIRVSNSYDIGLYLLEPTSFNMLHALPNKFFEFIQARLAVAIGPSPEMARIVREFGCGVVADDFSPASLARKLNALSADALDRMKRSADAAARVRNAESNAEKLRAVVADTLARNR